MGELGIGRWAEEAKRYSDLRRNYWRCLLAMLALLVALGLSDLVLEVALDYFLPGILPSVTSVLFFVFGLGCCACGLGSVITWSALMGFRCPECDERFILSSMSSWPTDRCKHCGLDLAAIAAAKPAVPAEL